MKDPIVSNQQVGVLQAANKELSTSLQIEKGKVDVLTRQVTSLEQANSRLSSEVKRLAQSEEMFRANMRQMHEALTAMRNDLNEMLHMPSLESDLLQGPEVSVFCATVVEAVKAALTKKDKKK